MPACVPVPLPEFLFERKRSGTGTLKRLRKRSIVVHRGGGEPSIFMEISKNQWTMTTYSDISKNSYKDL